MLFYEYFFVSFFFYEKFHTSPKLMKKEKEIISNEVLKGKIKTEATF